MSELIVRIGADASELDRVLSHVRGKIREAQRAINADARRATKERTDVDARASAETIRHEQEKVRATAQAERNRTAIVLRESAQRQMAHKRSVQQMENAEMGLTRSMQREIQKRSGQEAQGFSLVLRMAQTQIQMRLQLEQRFTRALQQQYQQRAQMAAQLGPGGPGGMVPAGSSGMGFPGGPQGRYVFARPAGGWGGAGGGGGVPPQLGPGAGPAAPGAPWFRWQGGQTWGRQIAGGLTSAAFSTAMDLHHQIQGARWTAAEAAADVGIAFSGANGMSPEEQKRGASMVADFAVKHKMRRGELGSALRSAQEFQNLLGNPSDSEKDNNETTRSQRLELALEGAREAEAFGADKTQHLRMMALLMNKKFSPEMVRLASRYTLGAARTGAIEEGEMLRGGMNGMMQEMNLEEVNTGETREQAQFRAMTRHVASMQIMRGFGNSATRASNTLSRMDFALRGNYYQDRMLGNILHSDALTDAQKQKFQNDLYEDDPTRHGQRRLKAERRTALGLADYFSQPGADGKPLLAGSGVMNLFGPHGQRDPQSMLVNWRLLLASMGMKDATGKTGATSIHELMNVEKTALNQSQVTAAENTRENGPLGELIGLEETRIEKLRDENSWMTKASDAMAKMNAESPATVAFLSHLQGFASSMGGNLGGAAGGGGIGAGVGSFMGSALAAGGATAAGAWGTLTGGLGVASLGSIITGGLAAGFAGLLAGNQINNWIDPKHTDSVLSADTWGVLKNSLVEAIKEGFHGVEVNVAPHDVIHATTVGSTGPNGSRPPNSAMG